MYNHQMTALQTEKAMMLRTSSGNLLCTSWTFL